MILDSAGQPILDSVGLRILDSADVWAPGDVWPTDTPGGAAHPQWGGYIRFWLLAEIAAGQQWVMGPDPNDKLDSGNVIGDAGTLAGGGGTTPGALPVTGGLWVDLSPQLMTVDIASGASSTAGILSTAEASTLTATLYDPTGIFDPYNPDTPYALGGRTRLTGGARVVAFAELVTDPATPTVHRTYLFTGSADTWTEPWTLEPLDRKATLVASDMTKDLVAANLPEDVSQGAGETVYTRLNRILAHYGFDSATQFGTGGYRTLLATTLAQSAWELITRAVADDLGYVYVYPSGGLVFIPREAWTYSTSTPTITLGTGGWDIATTVIPQSQGKDIVNTVNAARTGGTNQNVTNPTSIATPGIGVHPIKRTDLGLETDGQVAAWATELVTLSAFPANTLERITVEPRIAADPEAWRQTLSVGFVFSVVDVEYQPPNFAYTVTASARVVGQTHHISTDRWNVEWRTISANLATGSNTWVMGTDTHDKLDADNVLV